MNLKRTEWPNYHNFQFSWHNVGLERARRAVSYSIKQKRWCPNDKCTII